MARLEALRVGATRRVTAPMLDPQEPTMTSRPRGQQIAELYAREADRLLSAVSGRVTTSADVIEDACSFAWEQLVRHDNVELSLPARPGTSDRPSSPVWGWLVTVATREAWRLAAPDRETPSGGFGPGDGVLFGTMPEPIDPAVSDPADLAVQRSDHDDRAADLAQLKPRERRDLALFAAGLSYREIAAETHSTYTAVNRRINEARAKLARFAQQRGGEPPGRER